LLSYGIDLDMTVDNTSGHKRTRADGVDLEGTLFIKRKLVAMQEYARTTSRHEQDARHRASDPGGWKLVDTQTPVETTPTLYRFKAPRRRTRSRRWCERRARARRDGALLPMDLSQLWSIARRAKSEGSAGRDRTRHPAQQNVLDVERQIALRSQQIAEITAEQNRIRENMKTVAPSTPYHERLLAKLNEQESSIERLQRERDAMTCGAIRFGGSGGIRW